ncbi:isoflavone reductase family protein-like protein CipA [Dothidotthia symphoricarpi CBS 119687]|uniref:Isoflavone reductase family protein-like protein CipA n=1 Tax=Dothidotthia symphoricarpi CBS 119687 TaxID=1392245 RepID=A0A6A6AIW0_9PLEO|nr:isoflavone reductase family protein-like protein CipA [Dothidotthia symphoricarpi CBS 119687]KAF2131028.1 isoflavone reductase family protein-like protein CipA [Dothidotthia symphoricarpi CBS 119687]
MSYKNVIIVGAGGNLGTSLLDTFLKHSSFETSVLSREGSTSTFPAGVKVLQADYDSLSSLKNAFQGQDAVISLVAGSAIATQPKLIDAAVAAGVKHFIPSEFGSNTDDERILKVVPIFQPKVDVLEYLKTKESEISWTAISTGGFFDWGLQQGFFGLDGASKTATLFDEGKAQFSATSLSQIGLATIKVLEKPEVTKNQFVLIAGHTTSQNEILAVAEKVTGKKWTVKNVSAKEHGADGLAKLQKGDFSGIGLLIQAGLFGAEDNLGDNSHFGLWNEKIGLEKENFEETIKTALLG